MLKKKEKQLLCSSPRYISWIILRNLRYLVGVQEIHIKKKSFKLKSRNVDSGRQKTPDGPPSRGKTGSALKQHLE